MLPFFVILLKMWPSCVGSYTTFLCLLYLFVFVIFVVFVVFVCHLAQNVVDLCGWLFHLLVFVDSLPLLVLCSQSDLDQDSFLSASPLLQGLSHRHAVQHG